MVLGVDAERKSLEEIATLLPASGGNDSQRSSSAVPVDSLSRQIGPYRARRRLPAVLPGRR
jgi:hypothetical protein